MANPKLFVSYSWTNPDHEAWVLQISSELRESGIDVILDKWDLKEGHDAYFFMEKMVTDPEIKKVILVCDKAYVDKADGRSGGVGTETQIISAEIYKKTEQDKFVAIVTDRDEDGKAYLPAYYSSRIYIDLSDPSTRDENFDQLLRWVYDQPLHKKPTLGKKPAFLSAEEGTVALATSSRQKRALDALRNDRNHAVPLTVEYLTYLSDEMEKFRIDSDADPFDETVVKSIDSFLPYRDETIKLFFTLALYRDTLDTRRALHSFFEQLIPYLEDRQSVLHSHSNGLDNFRFIIHELFLYAIACLIRHDRFESAAYLMRDDYYVPGNSIHGTDVMVPFDVFSQPIRSLPYRNQRLQLRCLSLQADLLKERSKGVDIQFQELMQADFILFLRDHLCQPAQHWWPETLLHVPRHSPVFEVFARSRSLTYFNRVKVLLGIETKDELQPHLLHALAEGSSNLPRWQHISIVPRDLLGFDNIATKP